MNELSDKLSDKQKEQIEIALKKIEAIQRHISNVQDACNIIGRKLIERGELILGRQIIADSYLHDNSKLTSFMEWEYLFQEENKELLQLAVREHQSANPHHLEYWKDTENIPRRYLAQLVADTFARSNEFGEGYWEFMKNKFFPKYKIRVNSRLYKIIKEFADLLVEKPFEPIK
jgi:hypothetical protein